MVHPALVAKSVSRYEEIKEASSLIYGMEGGRLEPAPPQTESTEVQAFKVEEDAKLAFLRPLAWNLQSEPNNLFSQDS